MRSFSAPRCLEDQVRARTVDLERALDLLNHTNARLAEAMGEAEAARSNLASAIETVQDGFALFDADERLVMANSRYGAPLADVPTQVRPGLEFAEYVRMSSRSGVLKLQPGETPDSWFEWRMRRHEEGGDLTVILPLTGDRWMQVSEYHTREGGMVILHTDLTEVMRLEREERGRLIDDQARMVRATLDHLSQGVAIFDAGARLIGFNTRLAEHLSVPLARLRMGMGFATLFRQALVGFRPKGAAADEIFGWAEGRDPRPPLQFDLLRLTGRPGGDVLTVQGQEMPDGGFVMSFSDVTAERDAQRRLAMANETLERRVAARTEELAAALATAEQANAARARFVAAASHDLLAAALGGQAVSRSTCRRGAARAGGRHRGHGAERAELGRGNPCRASGDLAARKRAGLGECRRGGAGRAAGPVGGGIRAMGRERRGCG